MTEAEDKDARIANLLERLEDAEAAWEEWREWAQWLATGKRADVNGLKADALLRLAAENKLFGIPD